MPDGGTRLHIDERGRPTLQLPFGEVSAQRPRRHARAVAIARPRHAAAGSRLADATPAGGGHAVQEGRVRAVARVRRRRRARARRLRQRPLRPRVRAARRPVQDAVRPRRARRRRQPRLHLPLDGGAAAGARPRPRRDGARAHRAVDSPIRPASSAATATTRARRKRAAARRAPAGSWSVAPFAASGHPALAPLQIGGALVTSRLDDQLGLRGRTVFGEGVFFDRVFVDGRRLRRGLEASWARGPASLSWEYMRVSDQRLGMGRRARRCPTSRPRAGTSPAPGCSPASARTGASIPSTASSATASARSS